MAIASQRLSFFRKWFIRLEQGLWFLFLATLAFQTRVIVWQADTLFIEWRSAAIYLSDILFIALLMSAGAFWVAGVRCRIRFRHFDYALGVLFLAGFISVMSSEHRTVSWVALARLGEGLLLYGYVRWYALRRFNGDFSLGAFVLGALGQSVLGVSQFLLQHHVGLHSIGETILYPTMRGVAVFYDLAGEKTLRAYGTMPHPNVLAVQLVFALVATFYLYVRHSASTVRRVTVVWLAVVWALLWGFIATFSRTVIAAFIGAYSFPFIVALHDRVSSSWKNIRLIRKRLRNLFLVLLSGALLFFGVFWSQVLARIGISSHEEAVQLRAFYNIQAITSGDGFLGVNWFGAGIGNFVSWLMVHQPYLPIWQYQPAHNVYLLVYTEIGVIGLLALATFLSLLVYAIVRQRGHEPLVKWGLLASVGLVVFVALFDHFFWTLQQGRMMWWVFWGVVASYTSRE